MSSRRSNDIPPPLDNDLEDVHVALSAASTLWRRGEPSEALKWLRRAAGAAAERDEDERAVQLFKAAADVASALDAQKGPGTTLRNRVTITAEPPTRPATTRPAPPARKSDASNSQVELSVELDFDDSEDTVVRPETRVRRALMAIDPDYARRTSYPVDEDEDDSRPSAPERISQPMTAPAEARKQAVSPSPAPARSNAGRAKTQLSPPPLPASPARGAGAATRTRRGTIRGRPTGKPESTRLGGRRGSGAAGSRRRQPLRRQRGDSVTPPGGIRAQPRSTNRPPRPTTDDDLLAVTQKRPAASEGWVKSEVPLPPPGMLTALRVAVSSDADGQPQLVFLGTSEAADADKATALLVAPTEADAHKLAEIYQAALKRKRS